MTSDASLPAGRETTTRMSEGGSVGASRNPTRRTRDGTVSREADNVILSCNKSRISHRYVRQRHFMSLSHIEISLMWVRGRHGFAPGRPVRRMGGQGGRQPPEMAGAHGTARPPGTTGRPGIEAGDGIHAAQQVSCNAGANRPKGSYGTMAPGRGPTGISGRSEQGRRTPHGNAMAPSGAHRLCRAPPPGGPRAAADPARAGTGLPPRHGGLGPGCDGHGGRDGGGRPSAAPKPTHGTGR